MFPYGVSNTEMQKDYYDSQWMHTLFFAYDVTLWYIENLH